MRNYTSETKLHQRQNQWQEVTRQDAQNNCDQLENKPRNQISLLQETKPQSKIISMHLKCSNYCNGMRQHIHNSINSRSDYIMDTLYQKLNNGAF